METMGSRQRLRITFGCGEATRYVTHLDLMRLWERLLRRAGLPISYTAGQPPRPRLALAAPLAVGVTSDGELLDLFLDARLPLAHLARRLAIECPPGITVNEVQEVGIHLPSAQSLARFGEYRVRLATSIPLAEVEGRVAALLAATSLLRQRLRDGALRQYDLRPQVDSLWLAEWSSDETLLGMLLQTDEKATGRPDDVVAALGLGDAVRAIHRVKLILAAAPGVEGGGGRHRNGLFTERERTPDGAGWALTRSGLLTERAVRGTGTDTRWGGVGSDTERAAHGAGTDDV